MAEGRIYSVGYEGLTVPALIERLQQNRIAELVDVRANPFSRRPGFSKKRLAESLTGAGIEYRHEPLLGNAFRDVEDFHEAMGLMRETWPGARRRRRLTGWLLWPTGGASLSCAWKATSAVATGRSFWKRR